MPQFTEPIVEEAALAWLETLGYVVLQGPDIAMDDTLTPGGYSDVVLEETAT